MMLTSPEELHSTAAQLVARFYRALDHGTPDEVAALFTPDGEWLRLGERLMGPEAVSQALRKRASGRRSRHLFSNLLAETDGEDRITVSYAVTVYAGLDGAADTTPSAVLDSKDLLVRGAEGGWRFQLREGAVVFRRSAAGPG